jgi:hypothetical protein
MADKQKQMRVSLQGYKVCDNFVNITFEWFVFFFLSYCSYFLQISSQRQNIRSKIFPEFPQTLQAKVRMIIQ